MELKLKAESKQQELVLNYLEKNASAVLAEKINTGTKTLQQCWNYITKQAKKLAVKGCACIEDQTVYGWAVHFFEEDGIAAEATASEPVKVKKEKTPVKPKVKPVEAGAQISIFDLMG